MKEMRHGDSGDLVEVLQQKLELAGYPLLRFGADGHLGAETLAAAEDFAADHGILDIRDDGVLCAETVEAILDVVEACHRVCPSAQQFPAGGWDPSMMVDRRHLHDGRKRKRRRALKRVKYVCLHQTSCDMGTREDTRDKLAAHWLALRNGRGVLLNGYEWHVPHGHGWNRDSVGVEISGHFCGVEGNPRTHWVPRKPKKWSDERWARFIERRRVPMSESPAQTQLVLQIIRHIVAEVSEAGGRIVGIVAHRQSYGMKTSDPGSMVWQRIAIPAEQEHGFDFCGHLTRGSGRQVPGSWDARQEGVRYR